MFSCGMDNVSHREAIFSDGAVILSLSYGGVILCRGW